MKAKDGMSHPSNHSKFQSKRPVKIDTTAPIPVKKANKVLNSMRARRGYKSKNT